jgi:hypothetical protein
MPLVYLFPNLTVSHWTQENFPLLFPPQSFAPALSLLGSRCQQILSVPYARRVESVLNPQILTPSRKTTPAWIS